MPNEAVRLLTAHLNSVKEQAHAAIDECNQKNVELKRENEALQQQLQICLDELDFRNGLVEQLKLENSKKWRIEERNEWKSLVEAVQSDRDELQEENELLKLENDRLRCQAGPTAFLDPSTSDLTDDAKDDSDSINPRALDILSPPSCPSTPSQTNTIPGTPMTSLRKQLKLAKDELDHERALMVRERNEAMLLRKELDARRERERWRGQRGILGSLIKISSLWHRSQMAASTPILNV